MTLTKKIHDLEQVIADSDRLNGEANQKLKEDAVEIVTLRKACQLQKKDIEQLEQKVQDLQDEMYHNRLEADEKYTNKLSSFDKEKKEMKEEFEGELRKQEEVFMEERTKIKEQLHEVTSNEINLLNRIKCLEAEEGYSHAEVEKILVKEREMNEAHQEMQYKIECLQDELTKAKDTIEEQKSQVVIQRDPEDLQMIEAQQGEMKQLAEEIGYLKQELIDARAMKSASDDELDTVRGKVETLENNVAALSNEGQSLRKTINDLEDVLGERNQELNHLRQLVDKMEASATNDDVIRTEIQDLRNELLSAEGKLSLKHI